MRRRDLLGGVAASPLFHIGCASAAPVGDFTEAALALAGSRDLPPFVVDAAQRMLVAEFGAALVGDLIAAVAAWRRGAALPDRLEPLAQRLLVILYTGETEVADPRARAGHYPWALAWQVLRFTKAPGLCSGTFGDWART
ncbi:hypothetical protein [Neoroseomonas oryzicola]|uniref:Gluconate 2-dehydrogenase subunit 3 family protein n=1 Tax=Neoroseomonas oryzicola TaxID=535904 RepID=A0ABX1EG12_9PROT|nr:hypothetical protein [Neoroseomonas oryzicola]NKE16554.1 hypothetical protein [Neoroseomonas oryzicola]